MKKLSQKIANLQLKISLRAINPERNVHRYYTLIATKDLFGTPTLITSYGRIGTRGKLKHYYFDSIPPLFTKQKTLLNKRLNAKKRIGCNYTLFE